MVHTAVVDQTRRFIETEPERYVLARQGFTLPTIHPEDLGVVSAGEPVTSVLDAGCGHGVNLEFLVSQLSAPTGIGVEPSPKAVDMLRGAYTEDTRLSFASAALHDLPFESDFFDLTVCWSVLHWVGRNEYLQSIGELIRVTRKYLVIMDFAPSIDHRVPYRHVDGLYTFKQDFSAAVLASGVMRQRSSATWWEPIPGEARVPIEAPELEPFKGNPLNYDARRVCTFEKDMSLLPVMQPSDFGVGG
jgi:SAM-dependent methyltransferase